MTITQAQTEHQTTIPDPEQAERISQATAGLAEILQDLMGEQKVDRSA